MVPGACGPSEGSLNENIGGGGRGDCYSKVKKLEKRHANPKKKKDWQDNVNSNVIGNSLPD